MKFNGLWRLCDDGILRPAIAGEVLASDGQWLKAWFLIDTDADRTVISADILQRLGISGDAPRFELAGVGGMARSVVVDTKIRLKSESNANATFEGKFAALSDAKILEMSVLGRDITNLFAVIVDRPQDVVCLLAPQHRYVIVSP